MQDSEIIIGRRYAMRLRPQSIAKPEQEWPRHARRFRFDSGATHHPQ